MEPILAPLKFLEANPSLAEFLHDEGLRLSNIKSIKEDFSSTKIKGHSSIKSRFKLITIELSGNHTMLIETDQAYSFFRSDIINL